MKDKRITLTFKNGDKISYQLRFYKEIPNKVRTVTIQFNEHHFLQFSGGDYTLIEQVYTGAILWQEGRIKRDTCYVKEMSNNAIGIMHISWEEVKSVEIKDWKE